MKKLFLFLVLLCGATCVYAQDFAKFRIGLTAGANFSSTTSENADMKVGFNAGVKGEYNLSNELFLNASLLFDMKGAKSSGINVNANYLNIPIHIGYRYNISETISLFGEVGPYFAFGISGETEGIKTFDVWKTFDLGLGARIGAEFSKFQVYVGYDYGLTKLADVNDAATNTNLMAGIAYMF